VFEKKGDSDDRESFEIIHSIPTGMELIISK